MVARYEADRISSLSEKIGELIFCGIVALNDEVVRKIRLVNERIQLCSERKIIVVYISPFIICL